MPFLRVIRDKRGYETTYLMDWYQEAGRQRSRVLYAFRGPGGVRVGRLPLEPATMHELEVCHPGLSFDWKAILADRQVIESGPDMRRRRPRREDSPPGVPEEAPAPPKPAPRAPAAPQPSHLAIPVAIQGGTPAERIAFLAEWYPRVRERVEHRTTDPARRDALLLLAERLNAAAWDASADLDEPLAHAAEALERLARVLTRRRRRAGKRRTAPGEPGVAPADPSSQATPPEAMAVARSPGEAEPMESVDSLDPVDPLDSSEDDPDH